MRHPVSELDLGLPPASTLQTHHQQVLQNVHAKEDLLHQALFGNVNDSIPLPLSYTFKQLLHWINAVDYGSTSLITAVICTTSLCSSIFLGFHFTLPRVYSDRTLQYICLTIAISVTLGQLTLYLASKDAILDGLLGMTMTLNSNQDIFKISQQQQRETNTIKNHDQDQVQTQQTRQLLFSFIRHELTVFVTYFSTVVLLSLCCMDLVFWLPLDLIRVLKMQMIKSNSQQQQDLDNGNQNDSQNSNDSLHINTKTCKTYTGIDGNDSQTISSSLRKRTQLKQTTSSNESNALVNTPNRQRDEKQQQNQQQDNINNNIDKSKQQQSSPLKPFYYHFEVIWHHVMVIIALVLMVSHNSENSGIYQHPLTKNSGIHFRTGMIVEELKNQNKLQLAKQQYQNISFSDQRLIDAYSKLMADVEFVNTYSFVAEASSVPMSLRTIYKETEKIASWRSGIPGAKVQVYSKAYKMTIDHVFAVSFFLCICRIIPLPYGYRDSFFVDNSQLPSTIMAWIYVGFSFLNGYWGFKMVRLILRSMGFGGTSKSKKNI